PASARCSLAARPSAAPTRRAPAPRPPLLPYTTLFRSRRGPDPLVDRRCRRLSHPCRSHPPDEHRGSEVVGDLHGQRHRRGDVRRSEEHTSELQSRFDIVCRLLLEKKTLIAALGGREGI